MAKLCCFFCPVTRTMWREHWKTSVPRAGRQFGFPLFNPPETIGRYRVLNALSRGYYGATYIVERMGTIGSAGSTEGVSQNIL